MLISLLIHSEIPAPASLYPNLHSQLLVISLCISEQKLIQLSAVPEHYPHL